MRTGRRAAHCPIANTPDVPGPRRQRCPRPDRLSRLPPPTVQGPQHQVTTRDPQPTTGRGRLPTPVSGRTLSLARDYSRRVFALQTRSGVFGP